MMLCAPKFFCSIFILAVLGLTSPSASALNYEERNSITAGNDSINVIAREQSEVIIAIDSSGAFSRYRSKDIGNYVKANNPDLYRQAVAEYPNQSEAFIEAVAIGQFFFTLGRYSSSALMFERALFIAEPEAGSARKIEGLTTASYYGSARHIEGLKFICRQYLSRPIWNHEFRHAIHAHLRSLAVHLGHDYAEKALEHVRGNPDCRRADFSPIWIPIHLADMRWLEKSVAPVDAKYGISNEEDQIYAEKLLTEGDHSFIDYLHFVTGNYTKVLEEFPNSYVFDLALLGEGETGDYQSAKKALFTYIGRHPNKRRTAVSLLLQRAVAEQDLTLRNTLIRKYGDLLFAEQRNGNISFQINNHTRVWFPGGEVKGVSPATFDFFSNYYSRCPQIETMIYDGDFVAVRDFAAVFANEFSKHFQEEVEIYGYFGEVSDNDYLETCLVELNPSKLRSLISFIDPIVKVFASDDAEQLAALGTKLKLCGDLREKKDIGRNKQEIQQYCEDLTGEFRNSKLWRISLHKISALLLKRAQSIDPFNQGNSLFLAGLALRNNESYDSFVTTMQDFVDYYPKSDLADDAMAEIGWFHLVVRDDAASSDPYFEAVVSDYRDTNAYDNALNWLVISKLAQGNYISAAKYSSLLMIDISSERLARKTEGRHGNILRVASEPRSNGKITLARSANSEFSIFGTKNRLIVVEAKEGEHGMSQGDVIYTMDGVPVTDPAEAFQVLSNLRRQGSETVFIGYRSKKTRELKTEVSVLISDFGF